MTFPMRYLLLLVLVSTLAACGTTTKESAAEPKAMEMRNRIRTMEDSLFNSSLFEQRNAQALLDVYKAYAAALPLDSMAPEYLFRAAGVARSMKDPQQSVFLYDRVLSDYPGWYKLPDVYYLKAFVIDADLGQKGEAQQAYQTVINRYPDHPFAEQARLSIENLQYTDEELIEKFQRMSEEQQAKAEQ